MLLSKGNNFPDFIYQPSEKPLMGLFAGGPQFLWAIAEAVEFGTLLQSGGDDEILLYSILATVGFFGGLYALFLGKNTYQRYTLVKSTASERVRSIAIGRTEVSGVVRAAGDACTQPFDDADCVYAYWRLAEYTPSSSDDQENSWSTKAVGSYGTEFYLEGESGRQVLVDDPSDATVTLSDSCRSLNYVGANETPDDRIAAFCERQDISPTSRYRRRYTQDILAPGDTARIHGQAVEREQPVGPNNEDRILLTADESSGEFLISDKEESKLQTHYRNWSLIYGGGGLSVSAYCLWAWLTNGAQAGLNDALLGGVIGLVLLGTLFYYRERAATAIDRFKGDFG